MAAVAHGYVWAVVPVVAATLAPEGAKGRATAAVFIGSSVGLVIGGPASAAISQAIGWRGAAVVLAVMAGVVAVMIWSVLPPLPGRPRAESEAPPGGVTWWRPVGVICLVTAISATAHYVSYTYLALLVEPLGIDGGRYAVLLAAYGLAGLMGVRLVGRFIDRSARATELTLFAVFGVSLIALGPALVAGLTLGVIILVLLWAASFSAAPAVLQNAVLRVAPAHADSASAVYVVAFQVGIAAGSAGGAIALGPLDGRDLPIVSASLAGIALVLVWGAGLTQPRVRTGQLRRGGRTRR